MCVCGCGLVFVHHHRWHWDRFSDFSSRTHPNACVCVCNRTMNIIIKTTRTRSTQQRVCIQRNMSTHEPIQSKCVFRKIGIGLTFSIQGYLKIGDKDIAGSPCIRFLCILCVEMRRCNTLNTIKTSRSMLKPYSTHIHAYYMRWCENGRYVDIIGTRNMCHMRIKIDFFFLHSFSSTLTRSTTRRYRLFE